MSETITLSVIGEDQLPLVTKFHQKKLWDVAITSSVIWENQYIGLSVTLGIQMGGVWGPKGFRK